ncbi:ATP-binding protein [Sorangium sp. So ce296]|uniref:ATP-binding protein n=1 Tax=Sorangium sp. So ce296 TaxID=3133296 RepID=UPI003F5DFF23
MLPTHRRLPDVRRLIDQRESFVVHAPRRVGKTTSFLALAEELTAEGRHVALLVSTLSGADRPDEPGGADLALLHALEQAARAQLPSEQQPPPRPEAQPGGRLNAALRAWARALRRPLVVFFDDVDAFPGSAMDDVLRQLLRASLGQPAEAAPWTLALLGLHGGPERWSAAAGHTDPGAPEPILHAVRSITLPDFTRDDVAELYQQHTEATGQRFERAAVERAFALSRGQPWLVNALAKLLVEQLDVDRARPVALADVERAGELLLAARGTPLDRLSQRLQAPRIRAVFEPMIAGTRPEALSEEDILLVAQLGLVRQVPGGSMEVANPIYRELIARTLALASRASLPHLPPTWLRADGRLDLERLLDAFVGFWRRHGEALLTSASPEIAPYMVMTAFLDRVASGGGTLERAYGIGRGRMDLCLRYGPEVLGLTLKVWREGGADPLAEGLEQLEDHLAGLEARAGWLVLFDQRNGIPPVEERLAVSRRETSTGRAAVVLLA